MQSPWEPSREQLSDLLVGEPRYRIDQIWTGLYQQDRLPAELTSLPRALRESLDQHFRPALDLATRQTSSDGRTVKSLWNLHDGNQIESVLMHYRDRSTVCISTQAGCAMGCGFCSTGQGGYQRNLDVGEILEQVVRARRDSAPTRLSNIVFMGMGEPFANLPRVVESIERITTDFGIGARKVTVSTVGLVPQIRSFTDLGLQVGLAISLHAANDTLRDQLVPINKRHPIADLVLAGRRYREVTGRRLSFEWAMIDGVNDRDSDADELIAVAREAWAHVNLIPLNPTPGWPTQPTPAARIAAFRDRVSAGGVNVTVRANRGTDIDAACGQLRASQGTGPASTAVVLTRTGTPPTSATG